MESLTANPFRSVLLALVIVGVFVPAARAAKVIMKDGKIYEGKILAETAKDVVIKTAVGITRSSCFLWRTS